MPETTQELGPLPEPYSRFKHEAGMPLYTADQMRAYALQERAAARAQALTDAAAACDAQDEQDTRFRYDYRRGAFDCRDAILALKERTQP